MIIGGSAMKRTQILTLAFVLFLVVFASLCMAGSYRPPTSEPYRTSVGGARTFTLEIVEQAGETYVVAMDTRTSKLKISKFDPSRLNNKTMFSEQEIAIHVR
jgi:hypothetical protein